MMRALNLYFHLIGVQIRSQMQYPVSFLFDMLVNGANLLVYFATIALVFARFDNIGGWRMGDVAFLWGLAETSFGAMDMIFSGFDAGDFSQLVRQGGFDQLLLRPAGATLQVLGSRFVLRRWGRILQGMLIFAFSLTMVPVQWTPVKLMLIPVVIASQVAFFGGFFLIGSTLTFWTVQSIEAVNIFTYGGAELIAYPMHIYPDILKRIFTYIIPAAFINYYPALYILGKPDLLGMPAFAPFLAPLAGLSVLLAAWFFWSYGIRHYQGAGN